MFSSNFGNHLILDIDLFLLDPVGLLVAQNLITLLLVGFTPARSSLRPLFLPLMIGSAWITIFNSSKIIAGLSWVSALQHIDLCLLSQWNFEDGGPESSETKNGCTTAIEKRQPKIPQLQCKPRAVPPNFAKRVLFGVESTFAYRHIDTPYESKNTPHFDKENPEFIPTKKAFLVKKIVTIIRVYLVIDLLSYLQPNRTWKYVEFLVRIHEVTKEELLWRFLRVVGFWITVRSLWTGIYTMISLVAVGSGLSKPQRWRPLFASSREAYSIRRFWGNSWHQVLRGVLGNPASYICHDVLKIRNEFLARYIKLYLTFLISGLLHAAMDVAGGIPFNQQGSIRFLVTQAVGITAEDVVQSIYRKARGSGRKGSYPPISIRVVGSIWTLAFLVWSTPAWFYPEAHRRHMAPIKFSLITLASSYIKK